MVKYEIHPDYQTTGNVIKFCREVYGLTQKELGLMLGFSESTADVRIAQYEANMRTPNPDLIKRMAKVFNISRHALERPSLTSEMATVHTIYKMDSIYGLNVARDGNDYYISLPNNHTQFHGAIATLYELREQVLKGELHPYEYQLIKYTYGGCYDSLER